MSSPTPRSPLKPLFGTPPASFFGPKKDFCHNIVATLQLNGAGERIDPEEVLKRYTKEAILKLAFEQNIGVEDLIPLPVALNAQDIDSLVAEAANSGVQTFGIDGEQPPAESVAHVLLRFKALDDVCAPVAEWSAEKREFMQKLRGKLERFFTHS